MASISSLPKELVSEILSLVAASSFSDFFRAKLCCKVFAEVSEDKYVYQRISLNKFPIVPWHINNKVSKFLEKCTQSKNPEALYRKGVIDYFRGKDLKSALECLEEATKSGHRGAAYALGIISLFEGGQSKQKGMILLNGMKKSRIQRKRVKKCREDLQKILKMIWVQNPLVLNQRPICCTMQHKKKKGWLTYEIDEEENVCEGCTCDEEIIPICNALPQFLI